MKKLYYLGFAAMAVLLLVAARNSTDNPYGLKTGSPSIKSISAISFGPDGILFIGDSRSANVFAIDTKDKTAVEKAAAVEIKNIDQKIAGALGTEVKNIRIQDIAVNPISKKIYVAVHGIDGTPVLLTVEGDKVSSVSFDNIGFSQVSLANVAAEDAKDRNGRLLRDQ